MKSTILGILVRNQNDFISGEQMSRTLGISRAAIWKHIEALKKEGYEIESVTKKGYKLTVDSSRMETVFYDLTPQNGIGREHVNLEEVDSTNNYAKSIAERVPDGTVVISDRQNAGKGRMGRFWDSASGKGIWMSVVLKPELRMTEAIMMTHMAGAAVCDGLCRAGFDAKVKWPNDIVINGRKVCGILAEMVGEPDRLKYVVIGIGVNVNHLLADFPEELQEKAISLLIASNQPVDRNMILSGILERLDHYYGCILQNRSNEILEFCKQRSATLQQDVKILDRDNMIVGKAVDISDRGGLLVEDMNGQRVEIISGEVSVRGLFGYV
jgi:BirA family transcriptional regulator, biotin operon repressor / biotin---[acetyl-CoA-carboxylase] ligase